MPGGQEPRTESGVLTVLDREMKRAGAWAQPNSTAAMKGKGRRGLPDRIYCLRGRPLIAVEAKAPPGPRGGRSHPVSVHQARELKAINDAGGIAVIVDTGPKAREFARALVAGDAIHVNPGDFSFTATPSMLNPLSPEAT